MCPKLGIEVRDKIIETFTIFEDDQVYPKVLDIILDVLDSEYGVFGYIAENGDLICPSMTKDVWEKCQIPDKDIIFPCESWAESKAIWARAIIEKKTLYSNESLRPPEGHIPMIRAIVSPIMYQNNVIGVLEVANKNSDYTEDDVEALDKIASYISPILTSRLERDRQKKELKKVRKKKPKLDSVDKQILHHLILDGRQSTTTIKNKIELSHTAIQNRIKKLIESGILKIQGNINFNSLDLKVAYVNIELSNYNDIDELINHFELCPRVFLISRITGNYHIKMGIVGKDIDDLNNFFNHCLISDKQQINSSEIIFASDFSKPSFIPLNFFEIDNQNTPCGKNCLECEPYIKERCCGCGIL